MNIVLFEPEIPPNTGNIIRISANTGAQLHLVGKLAFSMDDKRMRRAGLDYHEYADVKHYNDFDAFLAANSCSGLYACSTKGTKLHSDITYQINDCLLFGPETRGLPDDILRHEAISDIIRIPMQAHSRSLNLANAVSVIVYEAWRQNNYA